MTDFDPLPDPYGSRPAHPHRTAAVLLWVIAGLDLILFGCCSLSITLIAFLPEQMIHDAAAQSQMPADQLATLLDLQPLMAVVAIVMFLAMVAPAIALIFLAFAVRRSNRRAIIASMILTGIQLAFVGLSVFGSIMQPGQLPVVLLVYGPIGVLLILAQIKLFATAPPGSLPPHDRTSLGGSRRSTQGQARDWADDPEPWNHHLN